MHLSRRAQLRRSHRKQSAIDSRSGPRGMSGHRNLFGAWKARLKISPSCYSHAPITDLIEVYQRTSHHLSPVTQQVCNQVGAVVGSKETAKRLLSFGFLKPVFSISCCLLNPVFIGCEGPTNIHAVDPYPVESECIRDILRQRRQGTLRRGVCGKVRRSAMTGVADDVDNASCDFHSPHDLNRFLHENKGRGHIYAEDSIPELNGRDFDSAPFRCAGSIHQSVNPAELFVTATYHFPAVALDRQICANILA